MSEIAPTWWKVKMTKSQVKQYIKKMKKAQAIAESKLAIAKVNWEFDKEEQELKELERKMDEIT